MWDFSVIDKVTSVGFSISGVLFYIFYNQYRNRILSAEQVKASTDVLGSELRKQLENSPDKKIAYAALEGIVVASGKTLSSSNVNNTQGVIHQYTLKELSSKRINGFWSDTKRTIRDVVDIVEFYLMAGLSQDGVLITEVADAEFIMDELTVIHDNFAPTQSSLLQMGMDRVFGEMVKGLHESEKMLLVRTKLLGLGELFIDKGVVKLGPGDGTKYILTKLSKKEVIKRLVSQSSTFKVLMIISGLVGSGCLVFLLWKFSRKYYEILRNRQILAEARQGRTGPDNEGNQDDCIICLTNRKEVVILNCGHVALCSECAQNLPTLTCPICRGEIVRFVPLYQA